MKDSCVIYKCRACGITFAKAHFPSNKEALGELVRIINGQQNSAKLSAIDQHTNCVLAVGVADIVGIGFPTEKDFGSYDPLVLGAQISL